MMQSLRSYGIEDPALTLVESVLHLESSDKDATKEPLGDSPNFFFFHGNQIIVLKEKKRDLVECISPN